MPTRLTDKSVENAKPGNRRREVADALLPGLYLIVQPSGVRSWAVRFRASGRPRKLTLGPWPRIGLKDARDLARAALRAAAEGKDPAAEKVEARRRGLDTDDLFGAVFDEYLRRHVKPNLRASTAGEAERLFERRILPRWRKRRLADITRRDILALVDDVVDDGARTTANRVVAALKAFFNWTVGRGILSASPAIGVEKPTVETSRDRVLSDDELRRLWRACDEIGNPFGPMVKLLLLTGARREEVRSMTDGELDLKARAWTLPATRTKNARQHEVHLSGAALAVLKASPRVRNPAGFVFCTNGTTAASGFSRAKQRIDALMAAEATIAPWRFHDLRRTVATGMARLGVQLPVVERCLNHVSGSFAGVAGVYQRHQFKLERIAAFNAWENFVVNLVKRGRAARRRRRA